MAHPWFSPAQGKIATAIGRTRRGSVRASVVTGIQPATVPVMPSITILKVAGVMGKGDAGITAETTE
jgi:hypothetical protein